jgi:hypothetical protein
VACAFLTRSHACGSKSCGWDCLNQGFSEALKGKPCPHIGKPHTSHTRTSLLKTTLGPLVKAEWADLAWATCGTIDKQEQRWYVFKEFFCRFFGQSHCTSFFLVLLYLPCVVGDCFKEPVRRVDQSALNQINSEDLWEEPVGVTDAWHIFGQIFGRCYSLIFIVIFVILILLCVVLCRKAERSHVPCSTNWTAGLRWSWPWGHDLMSWQGQKRQCCTAARCCPQGRAQGLFVMMRTMQKTIAGWMVVRLESIRRTANALRRAAAPCPQSFFLPLNHNVRHAD